VNARVLGQISPVRFVCAARDVASFQFLRQPTLSLKLLHGSTGIRALFLMIRDGWMRRCSRWRSSDHRSWRILSMLRRTATLFGPAGIELSCCKVLPSADLAAVHAVLSTGLDGGR